MTTYGLLRNLGHRPIFDELSPQLHLGLRTGSRLSPIGLDRRGQALSADRGSNKPQLLGVIRTPFPTIRGFYHTATRRTSNNHFGRTSCPASLDTSASIFRRQFRSSPPRQDLFGFGVFSCSLPMFKSYLLSLTRASLIVLPFWYRWRLSKHFPRASRTLLTIPLFAMCLVIAIGIDQSPRTNRWRLLLMTESEEVEWSHRRFEDLLKAEGHLILKSDDPRTILVKKVCDRLMTALDLGTPVSAATWPRDHVEVRERMNRIEARNGVTPSATTGSSLMPWKPESGNPEKVLEYRDWDLFIVDLPKINAFVLPTKEIFVYSGLLDLLDRDEEMTAAILAHEVSHVIERHAIENMGFSALSAVAFDVLRGISFALTMSFPLVSDGLATMINYLNDVVAERAYSRKLEAEADELGLSIMARAGYDPRAALALWGLLNELEEEQAQQGILAWGEKIPWTRTHPTGRDRQKAIEKALPRAMSCFRDTVKSISTTNLPTAPTETS